jgi:pyridoxal phosphate enzyme (YggS family)
MIDREKEIAQNIAQVQAEIAKAAALAGRSVEEITLIAASKTQSSETIRQAIQAGITVCGENRVQELLPHLEDGAYEGAAVHFIGHLQTNKVRQVVGEVSLIQSVDSTRLLDEIEKQAQKRGIIQDILLEVNIGREENKGGVMPEALDDLVSYTEACPHIRLRGLMCIPPAEATDAELRSFFASTRQLFVDIRNKIGNNNSNIDCLSMGMSGDFALAIAEGATMVRVGTALFGARPPIR